MPALPILEQIMADLVTAIEAVTVGNGYAITVTTVHQPATMEDFDRAPAGDYTVQLVQEDPQENTELAYNGNPPRVAWDQPVSIDLIYRPSDSDTAPLQKQLNIFEAAVIQSIMADPQRSNLAVDGKMSPSTWWMNRTDGTAGKSMTHTISYRHKENDPYNA